MSTKPPSATKVTVAVGVVIGLAILVAVLILAVTIMMIIIYKLLCFQHRGTVTNVCCEHDNNNVVFLYAGYLDPKSLKM